MALGSIIQMGVQVRNQPTLHCPAAGVLPPTDPKAVVFAPEDQILTVNGAVCVAVKTKAYFGTAVSQTAPSPNNATAPSQGQTAATGQAAGAGQTSAPGAAAQAAAAPAAPVTTAATDAAAAGAGTGAGAGEKLAIFIDNHKAPATFSVPRASADEWTWARVPLPASSDAKEGSAGDWRKILAGPTDNGVRTVKIGIGDAKSEAPRALAGEATLRIYRPWRLWVIGVSLVFVLGGAIMWGWQTGMLRDRRPTDAVPNPTFSLGRSQMAFWFLLTLAGFLYIWLVTGQSINVFTSEAVVLLGVSGATGLAAMVIGDDDDAAPVGTSEGYWTDILSDGGSIVVHRLQMVAWTAILGLLFGWSVVSAYEFKSLDTNLLLLSGIVSATYVGFKSKEPTPPAVAPAAGADT